MRQLRRSSRTKTFAIKFSPHTSPTKVKRSISLNSKAITTFTIPLKQKVKKEKIEENDTLQAKDQPESIEQKEANHGRISVAIRNLAPSSTSIIQLSEAFRVAGLNWRLQILFNRNTFTGQSRFISAYVICEDLPFNESLVTLITFRLVSQEEGYAGMDKEIIAHFNGSTRSAGISNFVLFKNIFAEDSEYLNKDFNEAQIVAIIRVKSRQKTILSINQKIKYLCQFPQTSTTQIFKNFELNKEDKNKKRRNKLFNLQINDKIVKEEQNEIKENILENNRRDNTLESIENKNPVDSACSLNDSTNNSRRRDISCTKNKITDFFPSRRSSRITPSFLDILRLQVLKEQVNLAVNEPYLEIFTSEIKGRGLRTQLSFAKDEFVVEYKGEIINMKRAKRRELIYSNDPKIGCYMFYFTHNEKKLCIDATKETGDKGRLVNHSRLVPNLKAKVLDFGEKYPHLCLVALREIQIGEELLFDYGDRTALTVEKHPWLLNT